jgi:hypothetical protein
VGVTVVYVIVGIAVVVGIAVGTSAGAAAGVIVGIAVRCSVGVVVGIAVGISVGAAVGIIVGIAVGCSVGSGGDSTGHTNFQLACPGPYPPSPKSIQTTPLGCPQARTEGEPLVPSVPMQLSQQHPPPQQQFVP